MKIPPSQFAPDEDQSQMDYLAGLNNDVPQLAGDSLPVAAVPEQPEFPAADEPAPAEEEPVPEVAPVPQAAEQTKQEEPWHAPFATAPSSPAPEATQSKLVNKAPDWYDFKAPPEYTGNEAAIMNIVAGLIQAGVAKDKKTAIAMALGGAADAATSKLAAPKIDYDNKLKAAQGQASMSATLRGSQANQLGGLNYQLAVDKYNHSLSNEQKKAEYLKATQTIGSPESNALVDSYIRSGAYSPEDKATLSGWQMQQARVGAQQLAGREGNDKIWKGHENVRTDHKVELKQLDNGEWDRRKGVEEGNKIEGEGREKQKAIEEAYIPGRQWKAGRPPPAQSVEHARQIVMAGVDAKAIAEELEDLQKKVSNPAVQALGGWNAMFGNVEQADVLAHMQALRDQLGADQRIIWGQGAPQKYELEANAKTNPEADSVFTFFRGPYAWRSLGHVLEKTSDRKARVYGSIPEGETEAPPAAPRAVAPQRAPNLKAAVSDSVDTVKNVAGQVADVAAPAVESGKVLVRVHGGKWMPAAAGALQKLKDKWGDALEVQTGGQK